MKTYEQYEANAPEFIEAKERLEARGITWSSVGNGSLLIKVGGRFFYYFPKNKRWRAKGKLKEYSCRTVDSMIDLLERG
jgi:hypothetical protein